MIIFSILTRFILIIYLPLYRVSILRIVSYLVVLKGWEAILHKKINSNKVKPIISLNRRICGIMTLHYVNKDLSHFSCIDLFIVSQNMFDCIINNFIVHYICNPSSIITYYC